MSIRYIKNKAETLLTKIQTQKDKGKFDTLNYKELNDLRDHLQKANALLDGVIQ